MAELRAALIGYGLAGSLFHGPLIAAAPQISLATVVTGNRSRASQARAEHPGVTVEPRAESIWERAGEHDLVVIATRNDSHVELAAQAIDAGLAVVVDKPLAPTSEAARGLAARAEEASVPLTVFHNRRWDSDQLTLRRLIADGSLGDVRRYESRFERWRPQVRPDAWRENTAPAEGGGVLLDLGTHLIDQALALFGPVSRVYGEVDIRRGGAADDDVFVALEHIDGVRSHLWASAVAGAPGPRLRVLGSRAAFVVDELDGQEDALRAGLRPATSSDWGAEPESRWGRFARGEGSEPVRSENGAWPRFYEQVGRALHGEGPMPVDPRDAVQVLEILERTLQP
ncbi:MAG TPA: Gfo/Idh/MocA family oxidoreductase [Solirubrobacterales bacterium]|nr:Gfo/Idh/MocA family oxidoreductase [Solirubrobacterales bacterium]